MASKTIKLKTLLEQVETEFDNDITLEQKREFVNTVKNFSAFGESVYGKENLIELSSRVKNIVEMAERIALKETDQWFDNVTVSRHMKGLKESYKIFEKTAQEMAQLQERLGAAYEDIGQSLNKYFEVE